MYCFRRGTKTCGRREVVAGFKNNAEWCKGKHVWVRFFHRVHCGNVADADVNAALNIATWGYVNTHERWELLSCPIHDDFSTSKANKSLVCW